jgi:hypothetical protein
MRLLMRSASPLNIEHTLGIFGILIFGAIFFKCLSKNSENKPLKRSFCVCVFYQCFEKHLPQGD